MASATRVCELCGAELTVEAEDNIKARQDAKMEVIDHLEDEHHWRSADKFEADENSYLD